MNIGDRIRLTEDELKRIDALEIQHTQDETDLIRRHRAESESMWSEIRKAHPELEGCVLKFFGDSLFVLKAPTV